MSSNDTLCDPESIAIENIAKPPPPQQPTFPEGGIKAWLTVAGSWLVLFCGFGYSNAFGVYQDYYTRIYLNNKTPSDISWIGSVQLMLLFSMGLVTGKLFDRGHFHALMIAGSALYVFCIFMLSLAQPHQYYQVFLAQGVGMGLALGLMFIPAVSVVAHHFRKRRVTAMGIVVSGSSCGGIVFPIMLNMLINKEIGFAWGVRATGFLILVLLIVANCCMSTRLPPKPKAGTGPYAPGVSVILTDLPYLLAVTGAFFLGLGIFFPFFYLQLYAITRSIDQTLAFYSLAILNAASVFGRVVPNFLADKFGIFNLLIPFATISASLIFAVLGVSSSAGLVAVAIVFGFSSGSYVSLLTPLFASLASSLNEIGLRIGIAYAVVGISALVGTPINGALLTGSFIWWKPIVFSGVCCFLGCFILALSRQAVSKRKDSQIV